ncbi:hypothetical protein L7F22_063543 [Adiantum nelumboides]|nr:hypothetical protein [Adiantum nelumboides]
MNDVALRDRPRTSCPSSAATSTSPSRRSPRSTGSPTAAGSSWPSSATWWWPPSTPASRCPRQDRPRVPVGRARCPGWSRRGCDEDPAHRRPDRAAEAQGHGLVNDVVPAAELRGTPSGSPERRRQRPAVGRPGGPPLVPGEACPRLAGGLSMVSMETVLDDLEAESASSARWSPTSTTPPSAAHPGDGWTVRDQLTHLAWFDEAATLAATDPATFRTHGGRAAGAGARLPRPDRRGPRRSGGRGGPGLVRRGPRRPRQHLPRHRAEDPAAVVRTGHERAVLGHRPADGDLGARPGRRGRARGPGADGPAAPRRPPGGADLRFHLPQQRPGGPAGARAGGAGRPLRPLWTWGPGRRDRVTGSALGFCLVATQRRHPDDTDVATTGPVAADWVSIAQTFANTPGPGRAPGAVAAAFPAPTRPPAGGPA